MVGYRQLHGSKSWISVSTWFIQHVIFSRNVQWSFIWYHTFKLIEAICDNWARRGNTPTTFWYSTATLKIKAYISLEYLFPAVYYLPLLFLFTDLDISENFSYSILILIKNYTFSHYDNTWSYLIPLNDIFYGNNDFTVPC